MNQLVAQLAPFKFGSTLSVLLYIQLHFTDPFIENNRYKLSGVTFYRAENDLPISLYNYMTIV